MNAMKMNLRRRNYFVDKPFQLSCAGSMLLLQLFGVVATAFTITWLYYFVLDEHLVTTPNRLFFVKAVIILIFMAVGVLIWTVKHTHAVAGPVYKMGAVLRNAARGSFPEEKLHFRKGDWFGGVARDVNSCLGKMKQDAACLREVGLELYMFKNRLESTGLSQEQCITEIEGILSRIEQSEKAGATTCEEAPRKGGEQNGARCL
jgi:hypothetical protein